MENGIALIIAFFPPQSSKTPFHPNSCFEKQNDARERGRQSVGLHQTRLRFLVYQGLNHAMDCYHPLPLLVTILCFYGVIEQ